MKRIISETQNFDLIGWVAIVIFFGWLFIKGEGWKGFQAPSLSNTELEQIIETNK